MLLSEWLMHREKKGWQDSLSAKDVFKFSCEKIRTFYSPPLGQQPRQESYSDSDWQGHGEGDAYSAAHSPGNPHHLLRGRNRNARC